MKSIFLPLILITLFGATLLLATGCEKDAPEPETEISTVQDSNGRVYSTLKIRDINKTWLAENLNTNTENGSSSCYFDNPESCESFGRLYSLEGAEEGCDALGSNWRVPSLEDWYELADYYGGYTNFDGTVEGDPDAAYRAMSFGGSSGFDVKLGGLYEGDSESYNLLSVNGIYWTTTTNQFGNKWSFCFDAPYFNEPGNVRVKGLGRPDYRLSCRCVKDND